MSKEQKTKEKTCVFYASDYHFEMITLPYIEKKIEENKKVVILTENNLEETMKTLISRINLNEEKKKKIYKINWKNDDLNKFKEIKDNIKMNKEQVILVKGKENYIKNINKNIEKWIENVDDSVKVIDCYDVEEIGKQFAEIVNQYENILSTTGEKKIEK